MLPSPHRQGRFLKLLSWLTLSVLALGLLACRGAGKPRQAWPEPRIQRSIKAECAAQDVSYPPKRVFLRAFKLEREMELWGANNSGPFHLLHTYAIAAASGGPGPKRQEGDLQVPEGIYRVAKFNPNSRFHLSMGLNYPNSSDRILGLKGHLGGDIYIPGNHVSAGCMAMTDPKIEEIYALAIRAKRPVIVHIFPCRLDTNEYRELKKQFPALNEFWRQLEPIYSAFQVNHAIPSVKVSPDGSYVCVS